MGEGRVRVMLVVLSDETGEVVVPPPESGRERWSQVDIQMAECKGQLDVGLLLQGEQGPRQACAAGSMAV